MRKLLFYYLCINIICIIVISYYFIIVLVVIGMENSAYVPNASHLNSPALVVFSQAGSGLQDALRIQRPFNPQVIIVLLL